MASSRDPKYGDAINNNVVKQFHRDLGFENGEIPDSYNGVVLREKIKPNEITSKKFRIQNQGTGLAKVVKEAFINMINDFYTNPEFANQELVLTSGYRDIQSQIATKLEFKEAAAVPGTSMHGWGIAIDLFWGIPIKGKSKAIAGKEGFTHPVYSWLHANAYNYGFYNGHPDGRLYDGNGTNEFWHWEYWGDAVSPSAGLFGIPKPLPDKYNNGASNTNETAQKNNVAQNENGVKGDVSKSLERKVDDLDEGLLNREQNLNALFKEIDINLSNIEADQVDADWGQKNSAFEKSDWIGLRQYILYLCTKYMPHTVYPFVELIPSFDLSQYESEGSVPKELEQQINKTQKLNKDQKSKLLKYLTTPPPGFDAKRYNENAKFQNKLKGQDSIDLFNLDPFQEQIVMMGVPSDSGKTVLERRNIGLRAYGQLVLSPGAISGVPSKPGAIGFTSIDIKAGSQSDNGLGMITMKLKDVQGNKFNDTASPWAFIFDAKPGSEAGDFYFRYGWSMRVPPPSDIKSNLVSKNFWNHPGWKLWGDEIKQEIMKRVLFGIDSITFTQANSIDDEIYESFTTDRRVNIGSIFASEVVNVETNVVTVNRNLLNTGIYTKLSLLNPEIDVDDDGSLEVTLNFRTSAAVTAKCYLQNAKLTRHLVQQAESNDNTVNLAELLASIEYDNGLNSINEITDETMRKKRESDLKKRLSPKNKGDYSSLTNLVKVIGANSTGGNQGSIDPNAIIIKIPTQSRKKIIRAYTEKQSSDLLIGWLREVLNANDCTLLSAAEGSGAGINATYIITTTQNIVDNAVKKIRKKNPNRKITDKERLEIEKSLNSQGRFGQKKEDTIKELITGFDVFSFRFQGSLVEKIKVNKSAAPNQMTIAADLSIGDFPTMEASSANGEKVPNTAQNRKRNLAVIYAQMQNIEVDCLCHPWLAPGNTVFLKGMGFFDGEYFVTEVSHSLSDMQFRTSFNAARVLPKPNESPELNEKTQAQANGSNNFTSVVNNFAKSG